jgi:hypothetical protein
MAPMVTTEMIKAIPAFSDMDDRELKLIRDCINYSHDPSGLPGGGLMLLNAKLADRLNRAIMDIEDLRNQLHALRPAPKHIMVEVNATTNAVASVETERALCLSCRYCPDCAE